MKNYLYGVLCGTLAFAVLSWATPPKVTKAAVLSAPPEGRFQLVQLHATSESEWSGILDTETGCVWVYTSQTPPTDAEVSAAPAGEQRTYKSYQQVLGPNFFSIVGYDNSGPSMSLPGGQKLSTIAGAEFSTLATQNFYCDEIRHNAIMAAVAH